MSKIVPDLSGGIVLSQTQWRFPTQMLWCLENDPLEKVIFSEAIPDGLWFMSSTAVRLNVHQETGFKVQTQHSRLKSFQENVSCHILTTNHQFIMTYDIYARTYDNDSQMTFDQLPIRICFHFNETG